MLHPLASLISNRKQLTWEEADIKHFIQGWLRERLGSNLVYCDGIGKLEAKIRVSSATLQQEAMLLEHDLISTLKEECDYSLKCIKIKPG